MLVAGCGDDDEGEATNIGEEPATSSSSIPASTSSSAGGGCQVVGGVDEEGTPVAVTLDEWTIAPDKSQVGAGVVTFAADNVGEEPHEIVVVKAESPDALPVDEETGAMDEEALAPEALIGEIEAFPAGEMCTGSFDLPAATYVLVWDIVESEPDGNVESHLDKGMATAFIVSA